MKYSSIKLATGSSTQSAISGKIIKKGGKVDVLQLSAENCTKLCAKILNDGGVVAVPTDTVYGLIADATDKRGISKIFQIKRRDEKKMLPVFVKGVEFAQQISVCSAQHINLLRAVWPGTFTIVLPLKEGVRIDALVTAKKERTRTIAMRAPKQTILQNILRAYKNPLAQTSANPAGMPPATSAEEVLVYFKHAKTYPDLILEGRCGKNTKPSTILDLTETPWKELRKGHISKRLSRILQRYGVQFQQF